MQGVLEVSGSVLAFQDVRAAVVADEKVELVGMDMVVAIENGVVPACGLLQNSDRIGEGNDVRGGTGRADFERFAILDRHVQPD